jgi:HSP20 family protein
MAETRETEKKRRVIRPLSSICEENGKVIIRLEMPGVKKEDLDVRIEKDELIVSGKREPVKVEGRYLLRERADADYAKVYTLDETIDHDSIDAVIENGILTIKLAMKESVKPKKIEVKVG